MDKSKYHLLSDNEAVSILAGFIIGVGFLALPNQVAKEAKNDAGIATIVGGIYPLYFAMLSIYYCKKHPNEDVLKLSKKYLGNIIGIICNILFMAQFMFFLAAGANGYKNVLVTYATQFLSPMRVFLIVISIGAYVNFVGLKPLARINKIALFFTIAVTSILSMSLIRGRYLNLLPLFGTGVTSIIKGSLKSAYAYTGMEGVLLLYPLMKNKDKIAAVSLKATTLVISIYGWVVLMSIYYLGYKVTTKTLWPVLLVTESANLPFINSFRLVFILFWSINVLKLVANEYYAVVLIIQDTLKIKEGKQRNIIILGVIPIAIYLCLKLGDEVQRRAILEYIVPKSSLFNIIYATVIAILIFINDKRKKKSIG